MSRPRTAGAKIDEIISKYEGQANIPGFIGNIQIFAHYTVENLTIYFLIKTLFVVLNCF